MTDLHAASGLYELLGVQLTEVRFVHDCVQLVFEAGQCVTINNDCTSSVDHLNQLIYQKLKRVCEASESVKFQFDGGDSVDADLCDAAWNGPEAMTLSLLLDDGSSELIVW